MAYIRDQKNAKHRDAPWIQIGGTRDVVWGREWFVSSAVTNAADNTAAGRNKTYPFNSLGYLFTNSTITGLVAAGDVVHVGPGHTETIASATACAIAESGIHVIGHGGVTNRPTFTVTTLTTANIPVTGANNTFENLRFVAGKQSGDDVAAIFTLTGAGNQFINCEFRDGGATNQAQSYIVISTGANDTKILGCHFLLTPTDTGCNQAISIEPASSVSRTHIRHCVIHGDFANAAINSTKAHLECLIEGNDLWNAQSGDHCIQFSAAATGTIRFNTCYLNGTLSDTLPIDKGSCGAYENYACDADADKSAVLKPAATE